MLPLHHAIHEHIHIPHFHNHPLTDTDLPVIIEKGVDPFVEGGLREPDVEEGQDGQVFVRLVEVFAQDLGLGGKLEELEQQAEEVAGLLETALDPGHVQDLLGLLDEAGGIDPEALLLPEAAPKHLAPEHSVVHIMNDESMPARMLGHLLLGIEVEEAVVAGVEGLEVGGPVHAGHLGHAVAAFQGLDHVAVVAQEVPAGEHCDPHVDRHVAHWAELC